MSCLISLLFFKQIANVIKALEEQKSPLELVQMPVLTMEYKHKSSSRRNSVDDEFTERIHVTRPMFSCCWIRLRQANTTFFKCSREFALLKCWHPSAYVLHSLDRDQPQNHRLPSALTPVYYTLLFITVPPSTFRSASCCLKYKSSCVWPL